MLAADEMTHHIREFYAVTGFPLAVRALDGCHFPVSPPKENAIDYYNYKGWLYLFQTIMLHFFQSPPPLSPVAGPSGPRWPPSPNSARSHSVKIKNEQCSKRSICEEGTCCLDFGGKRKRCKPLAKRGEHCVEWAITTVYVGVCPCDPYQGICQLGICV
ncbi:hypothetical protein MRX96_018722 [Rhipicephalus microplus]